MGAGGAATVGPRVEVGQLHAQDRGLQLVQARVVADLVVGDLVVGAVEAQRARTLGDTGIGCGDGAAVAEPPEVLGGKEGESGRGAERAGAGGGRAGLLTRDCGAAYAHARAGGLGGVLEHGHAQRLDLCDGREVAEQVHGDHGLRARGERGAHRVGGDAVGVGVDVAEHRGGARRGDRLGGGVEAEGGHHHLVARADAHRAQGDRDRVGAVGHADGVRGAAVGGELLLEGGTSGPRM